MMTTRSLGVHPIGLLWYLVRHCSLTITTNQFSFFLYFLIPYEYWQFYIAGVCLLPLPSMLWFFDKFRVSLTKQIWVFRLLEHSTVSLKKTQDTLDYVGILGVWLNYDLNQKISFVQLVLNWSRKSESNWIWESELNQIFWNESGTGRGIRNRGGEHHKNVRCQRRRLRWINEASLSSIFTQLWCSQQQLQWRKCQDHRYRSSVESGRFREGFHVMGI